MGERDSPLKKIYKLMNNNTIIIYYLYVLAVLALFTWIVFIEGHTGWWFLLAVLLTQMAPTSNK